MNICVFGSAQDEIAPGFIAFGETLGREMARRGHTLIFGAGAHGMMGAAARGITAGGGKTVGIVPTFFDKPGILFDCTETVMMETMAERKTIMRERADAFIALPGGIGTMEEILEVITLRNLSRLTKPVAFLDTLAFWKPMLDMLQNAVDRGFAKEKLMDSFAYFTDPEKCLDYLESNI